MEDTPVPPPHPILRCDHGEETHVKQFRYPYDRYTIVSIYFFSLQFDYFYFHHSLVNVIERRINFAEVGPVQFLSVDCQAGDVEPANSSISI
jgi:hypothetical protein